VPKIGHKGDTKKCTKKYEKIREKKGKEGEGESEQEGKNRR